MADIAQETQSLFERYLRCWNARDFEGVADCFGEPAMFILPGASLSLPDRTAMVTMLEGLFERLEGDGFSHTTLGQISPLPCGPDMAVVDVRSVTRLRKDGSVLEEIDAHYVMQRSQGVWRFSVAVTCAPGWRGN